MQKYDKTEYMSPSLISFAIVALKIKIMLCVYIIIKTCAATDKKNIILVLR